MNNFSSWTCPTCHYVGVDCHCPNQKKSNPIHIPNKDCSICKKSSKFCKCKK